MNPQELKVGDKIRITGPPVDGNGNPYYPPEVPLFKKLAARRWPFRICEIDVWGVPWYHFRLKTKKGTWVHHFIGVFGDDNNWVKVKPRKKK